MVDRYATNAFTNFANFESGVFGAGEAQTVGDTDNPQFLWPSKTLRNAVTGNTQPIQRGYMRTLAEGYGSQFTSLAKKRLHFQFNPDSIVRSVSARNDIQLWMNQDPVQLMQPIPGDANFAFELLFNREEEVVTGTYSNNGRRVKSRNKANLPTDVSLTDRNSGSPSVSTDPSAVTDIGVLADLIVFDEIIGQGVNRQLIDRVVRNAAAIAEKKNQAIRNAKTTFDPIATASASVSALSSGKITQPNVRLVNKGSGYTSAPQVSLVGGGGTGAVIKAVIDGTGKVSELVVEEEGSGYTSVPLINFSGGGEPGSSSSDSTSDTQDQEVEFNEADAAEALTANFGNSAFLVSLPVRIVFSSLFMVEGYITNTTVTFNKFNPSMVPIQCAVGISMQALYIGFARKDTYLTKTLADALDEAEETLRGTSTVPTTAQKQTTALGGKLFDKFLGNYEQRVSNFAEGDFTQTFSVKLSATDILQTTLQQNNTIKEITQNGEITIIYKGNSSTPPTPPSPLILPSVDSMVYQSTATSKFNLKDLKDSGFDVMSLKFVDSTIRDESYYYDKTSTSKYLVQIKVYFDIITASGETTRAAQRYHLSVERSWDEVFNVGTNASLPVDNTNSVSRYIR